MYYVSSIMYQVSKRILAIDTREFIGKEVTVKGWVKTRRDHGKLIFLDILDRSGIVQVVVNPKASQSAYSQALELRPEYVVQVMGVVNKRPGQTVNKDIKTGEVEISAAEVKILAIAETLPFEVETPDLELPTLLDHRALTLRSVKSKSIFSVQETIVASYRKTLKDNGFTEIFVPTIVPSATEGGAEVFKVDYYGHKAFLAQSPQMYKQIMVSIFERVFTVAHAYRAEPSVTTRHLSEYVSLDAEMGFIDSWEELAIKTVYVLTEQDYIPANWTGKRGRMNPQMIAEEVPDYMERIFYLSGPHTMIEGFEKVLKEMGVKNKNIKKDLFPGLV